MQRPAFKKTLFAMPSSKTVVSQFYQGARERFLNLSITGPDCALQCTHCRGSLLRDMVPVAKPEDLMEVLSGPEVCGCLLSGGFDKEGKIDFSPFFGAIRLLKDRRPGLKVYLHTGFVLPEEARQIRQSGADGALVNAIGSQKAIEEVYRLKGKSPDDYLESIRNLLQASVKVSPHIIVGLEDGRLASEPLMIEKVAALGVDHFVLAAVKKISKAVDPSHGDYTAGEFAGLVRQIKRLRPDAICSIGCARPPFLRNLDAELEMIRSGADILSFPSEETLRHFHENRLPHAFLHACCAAL